MVRRRAAKIASTANTVGSRSELKSGNGGNDVVSEANVNFLDEQYLASPKRKDCKLDKGMGELECAHLEGDEQRKQEAIELKLNKKSKPCVAIKNKCERSNIVAERAVGVPLATRSQTRTIENFFKANVAKRANAQAVNEKNIWNTTIELTATEVSNNQSSQAMPIPNGYVKQMPPDLVFDLSEDTNDTDNTEFSDEIAHCIDFAIHRSALRDSYSSRSSTSGSNTDNIFLQEPVLTLNVDKTLNQACSIKINTSLDVEPVFSSPPALTTALNGRFNQIVSLNGGFIQPDNDNSSCDSGVAFTTSFDSNNLFVLQSDSPTVAIHTRRRKPATPHRILCPSPVKAAPRTESPASVKVDDSSSGRKCKEQLSPRKSQRQLVATNSKSRRRLNQQKGHSSRLWDIKVGKTCTQKDCKQNGDIETISLKTKTEPENLEFENIEEIELCGIFSEPGKHTTIQQSHGYAAKSQNKCKPQAPRAQPKTKHQTALPLAATNGNRELTEFFPVRRSVRKTKSAVKEEMMRNLEQAIIEERTEGLKIAHFEGKGRGIVADRRFQRGEFVVEYVGDLISMNEAAEREKRYALDENAGCYMYYFKHKNQQYCIDATVDTGKLGRLVNHSRNGNLITKVVVVKQRPHLILIAKDNIDLGEELTYDYGDRSKESLLHHPWLAF